MEKDHIRVEAYGTVDELISQLGVCYATTATPGCGKACTRFSKRCSCWGLNWPAMRRGLTRLSQTIGEEEISAWNSLSTAICRERPLKQFVIPGN
ncbi:hypothetical protein CQA78_29975 [Klebsiella pneumoniae]|nr:hypothetical protein CQA78_29975 [Klebsiella pneumoniae]